MAIIFGEEEAKVIDSFDNNYLPAFEVGEHDAEIESVEYSVSNYGPAIKVKVSNDEAQGTAFINFSEDPEKVKLNQFSKSKILTILNGMDVDKATVKKIMDLNDPQKWAQALQKYIGVVGVAVVTPPYGNSKYNQVNFLTGRGAKTVESAMAPADGSDDDVPFL